MQIYDMDPITLKNVADLENAPYVIDGEGHDALKIYFENEANKAEYLAITLQSANITLTSAHT